MAGGVVGYDLVGNLLAGQLPGGEGGALAARAGFVAIDVEFLPGLLGGVERRGGAANIYKGQPAGVAMREDVRAGADQFFAVPADGGAVANVLAGKFLGGGQGQGLLLGHGGSGPQGAEDGVHGVDRVNRGRAGGLEGLINEMEMGGKPGRIAAAKSARTLGQAVGGGRANGAGAAHDHLRDGPGRGAEIGHGRDLEAVRQPPLLDQADLVAGGVESDRAEMAGAAAQANIHIDLIGIRRGGLKPGRSVRPESTETGARQAPSGFLEGAVADSGLDFFIPGVFTEILEVRVPGHPVEIIVTEIEGGSEGLGGQIALLGQGIAAGQVVMHGGIVPLASSCSCWALPSCCPLPTSALS